MPAHSDRRRPHDRRLGQQFLGPVLAEVGHPGVDDLLDPRRIDGLGGGDEGHRRRVAPGPEGGGLDPPAHLGNALGDGCGHAVRTMTTA